MISFTGPAFILRSRDRADVDRLYTIYTKDRGKLDVIAKGIRKQESKLQSSIQIGYELEVYIIAQRRFTLGGGVILEPFPNIHKSFSYMWAMQHVLEMIDLTTKAEHPDAELYAFMRSVFVFLETHDSLPPERLVYIACAFDVKLLDFLGTRPRLQEHLPESQDDYFALMPDGLHKAEDVRDKPHAAISKDMRSLLRFAQQRPFENISSVAVKKNQAKELLSLMQVFYHDTDVQYLRSNATVDSFINT